LVRRARGHHVGLLIAGDVAEHEERARRHGARDDRAERACRLELQRELVAEHVAEIQIAVSVDVGQLGINHLGGLLDHHRREADLAGSAHAVVAQDQRIGRTGRVGKGLDYPAAGHEQDSTDQAHSRVVYAATAVASGTSIAPPLRP